MNLQEAIEILTKWREEGSVDDEVELHEAERLGIEALKAWERIRIGATSQHLWKLPGETEE